MVTWAFRRVGEEGVERGVLKGGKNNLFKGGKRKEKKR